MTEIPKYDYTKSDDFESQAPCWVAVVDSEGKDIKPLIVCKCGIITGIGLHHVHADGRVTASFWHKKGNGEHEDPRGCDWHVHLKLLNYDKGEFLPDKQK
jgi:hypothetical protein